MKTVLFFIAGRTPTSDEQTQLTTLLGDTEFHQVLVRSAAFDPDYAGRPEPADFIYGDTIPAGYESYPVFTPGSLPPGSVAVSDGDTVQVSTPEATWGGAGTAVISEGELIVQLPEGYIPVADGSFATITVNGNNKGAGDIVVDEASGSVSLEIGPDNSVVVNSGTLPVHNSANDKTVNATSAVDGTGNVTAALPATAALITNAQALTGVAPTGTYTDTVTFAVSGGHITGITLS